MASKGWGRVARSGPGTGICGLTGVSLTVRLELKHGGLEEQAIHTPRVASPLLLQGENRGLQELPRGTGAQSQDSKSSLLLLRIML